MGLADRIQDTQRSESGIPCGVAVVLRKLHGEDREAMELVLSTRSERGTISNRQLHQMLVEEGYNVAFSSIAVHRRKQCRCFIGVNAQQKAQMAGVTS